jgi:hypothetical protein
MYSQDLPLDAFDLPPETVRGRFAWAERQGMPRWLWPDTAPDAWSAALTRIEAILRAVLTGGSAPPLDGDPAALDVAAYTSGTGPLLGVWLEQGRITASEAAAAMLAYHLRHNRLRMQRLTAEAASLCRALGQAGVAPVLVKGMHTAHRYFPEPGARPASDVDLVVPPDRLGEVEAVLLGESYVPGEVVAGPPSQREWRAPDACAWPRTLCFVHHDDPWAVDVQTSFDRRFTSGGTIVCLDKAVRDAGTEAWLVEGSARVLRQPWLLLYLAAHASNGFQNLTLLRLTELALVARADAALDWDAFIAAAEGAGARGLIYPALHLTETLAPGTLPAYVLQASRAAAPDKACHFIERLTPASAHRLLEPSRAEKFLWSPSRTASGTQILREILPREASSFADLARIYRRRAWKLARGTLLP